MVFKVLIKTCTIKAIVQMSFHSVLRPVARAGVEGVWTNPPCSLAKFILTRQQQYMVAIMQLLQGVVTYTPVEAFAPGIKNFDR